MPLKEKILPAAEKTISRSGSPPGLYWLLLLAVGSGCAALIYEVVWFQLLQLVIGSSAVSLGLLLATYMGGMCVGSIALPRFVSSRQHPLRVYALLESGVGIFGILVFFGVPLVGRLYITGATHGLAGIVLRGLVAALCLLPPTLLMGGSLPAAARWVEATPRGVSWLGFFYGGNILGAVLGSLLAGFYLLRVYDMAVATWVAVAINLVVACVAGALATRLVYRAPNGGTSKDLMLRMPGFRSVYAAVALSGFCALGAEVVWTRLLSLLLGATVYTFSIILGVFLAGLGLGSGAGSFLARHTKRPRRALGWCEFLLAAAVAWTAFMLSDSLPYWPVDPFLARSPWFNFQIDLLRCMWAILPPTFLWGASFPLALAAAAGPQQDPGQLVGEVYAANTAGAILGAILFSLVLIPSVGTRDSERLLIALSAITALVVLVPLAARAVSAEPRLGARGLVWMSASTALALVLASSVHEVPWPVVAYGRRVAATLRNYEIFSGRQSPRKLLFQGEGVSSSVVVTEIAGQREFFVSGKAEASTTPLDMRLQRMLGHIPALIHKNPSSVLVVGFGAGVTAGSFVVHPEVRGITICEIEPLVSRSASRYFTRENHNVLGDSRTHMIYDDARHYLSTTKEKFDIITSDPIHPWVRGSSTLYSKEYFDLTLRHLNPGGVVTQWVPLYDSDPETVKSALATFFSVFPDATVWSNNVKGEGYDLVLMGRKDPAPINVDELQQRLDRPDYSAVADSLRSVGFLSAIDVLATYAGRASDLTPWVEGAPINREMNLRLQYLAGMGLNFVGYQAVYREMLRYRNFPEGLFSGSDQRVRLLRVLLVPAR